ncbi:hypothetical protein F5Y16DRAFT_278300 [Xylariaceae sp. FL0255]|nr:hypothetical protein F5Y16DRAFT_278300 [Xylariaceae sp. FL0255]
MAEAMNMMATRNETGIIVPKLPAENGVQVYHAAVVLPFVTFIFVAARFYARFVILRGKPTIDDYIVGMTLVFVIIYSVLMGLATYHGMGLHIWQYTPELNSQYYLWIGISSEFYCLALAGFKSALILLYLQTFGLVSRKFRIACYLTLFYTLGYLSSNLLTEFLGCTPVSKFWEPDTPGHCIDKTAANTFYGIGHVTSDLIIGILPLPSIWRLSWPSTRQKLGLSLTLTCGFLAWAVATVRYVISTYDQFTYDRTWWAGIGFALSILEVNIGLMCACVPTLSPLLSCFSGLRTQRSSSSGASGASDTFEKDPEKAPWDDIELNIDISLVKDAELPSQDSKVGENKWEDDIPDVWHTELTKPMSPSEIADSPLSPHSEFTNPPV